MCPSNAATMPTSGAWSHSVPRAVSPPTTGKAAIPTIPITAETSTAAPRPPNRLRGIVLPGSRASWARFATVSRPVYASIASGSEYASACQRRRDAGVRALPRSDEREEQAEPEADQDHLRDERDDGDDHDRDAVEARAADQPQHRDRQDDEHRGDDVPRVVRQPHPADRVAEVVRREERRERDHDRVVEEQHPARQEAGRVVERAAGEHRRAAGLGDRRRPLGVRERDEHEERARRRAAPTASGRARRARRSRARSRSTSRPRRRRPRRATLRSGCGRVPAGGAALPGRQVEAQGAGGDEHRAEEEPEPAADAGRERAGDHGEAENDQQEREAGGGAVRSRDVSLPAGRDQHPAGRLAQDVVDGLRRTAGGGR